MTKLDGTARGGVLVAAAEKYGLPIHAIGVGEGRLTDLRALRRQRSQPHHRRHRGRPEVSTAPKTEAGPGLKAGIEYGPLVLFFAVNFLAPMGR